MTRQTIAKLAWYMPRTADVNDLAFSSSSPIWGSSGMSHRQEETIMHYAKCHANLAFGWDFAKVLVEEDKPFPAFLSHEDIYVWRAYNFMKGTHDPVIEEAVSYTLPSRDNTRWQINALLVADDVDTGYIAKNLGLNKKAVEAYEKLFFNVLDRKKDHSFIASIVYPNGRLVEAYENYIAEAKLEDLLLRAGFKYGPGHVLYAAGLGSNPFAGYNATDGAEKLDAMFMADGCLYATLGWMHSIKHSRPIENARLSMQASKMGGQEKTAGQSTLSFGEALKQNLIFSAQRRAEYTASVFAGHNG